MALLTQIYTLALVFVTLVAAIPQPPKECPKGAHILAARGDGHDPPARFGGLSPLLRGIERNIPGSTNESVPYPKKQNGSVKVGERNMKTELVEFVDKCPDTPIVMAGYSAGAIMTMNVICGDFLGTGKVAQPLSTKYLNQIVAVILYGDESRVPDQPYDRGTCKTAGITPRLNAQNCLPYAKVIRSWCDSTDPLCCVGGTNGPSHKEYGPKYDPVAIAFAVSQYKKHEQKLHGHKQD